MSSGFEKLTGYLRGLFGVDVSGNGVTEVQHAVEFEIGEGLSATYNELTKKATLTAALTDTGVSTLYRDIGSGEMIVLTGVGTLVEGTGIRLVPGPFAGQATVEASDASLSVDYYNYDTHATATLANVSKLVEGESLIFTPGPFAGQVTLGVNPAAVVQDIALGRRVENTAFGTFNQNMTADFGSAAGAQYAHGFRRIVAVDLVGAHRGITLGTTGCLQGDTIECVNLAEAYNLNIVCDGITTLPPGWGASAMFVFNGTVWKKLRTWVRPSQFDTYAPSANVTVALCKATATISKKNRILLDPSADISIQLLNDGAIYGDVIELALAPNSIDVKTCTVKDATGATLEVKTTDPPYSGSVSRYLYNNTNWINWSQGQ